MIKSIIFDLGRVLISFYPEKYCQKTYDKRKANTILNEIFRDKIWLDLDKGVVSDSEAIESIYRKGNLEKSEIEELFRKRSSLMESIDVNTKLIKPLKERGYNLYVISNFPKVPFEEIRARDRFFEDFDGMVISSYINMVKPDRKIFDYTINRYNLNPNETLFIDDHKPNTESAETFGINTIHLTKPENLETELKKLDIL